jgi:hypothetical protein
MTDRPRLLHRRLELGYTDQPVLAAAGEPEAIDGAAQAAITRSAQLREAQRRGHNWAALRARFQADIAATAAAFGPLVTDELRSFRRGLDRIDRKLSP